MFGYFLPYFHNQNIGLWHRELAQQIQKVVMALGDYMGAQCHACIGGTSVREDMRKLDAGQHIVVGECL